MDSSEYSSLTTDFGAAERFRADTERYISTYLFQQCRSHEHEIISNPIITNIQPVAAAILEAYKPSTMAPHLSKLSSICFESETTYARRRKLTLKPLVHMILYACEDDCIRGDTGKCIGACSRSVNNTIGNAKCNVRNGREQSRPTYCQLKPSSVGRMTALTTCLDFPARWIMRTNGDHIPAVQHVCCVPSTGSGKYELLQTNLHVHTYTLSQTTTAEPFVFEDLESKFVIVQTHPEMKGLLPLSCLQTINSEEDEPG